MERGRGCLRSSLRRMQFRYGPAKLTTRAKLDPPPQIPLIYPPSFMSSVEPMAHLRALLAHRSPLHRRRTWLWVGIAPLTAPFAILPIIPNLPFFFCVWRAWSHWKGWLK